MARSVTRAVLTVFLPFAGGYFLSYLFRSVNAVIAPQLTRDIALGAGDLGLLTAAYFLAFASFQIPLGILLDRFGPRRVQSALLLVAALGALIFALGESKWSLIAGRALIGLGVAGGLMASFKAITLWFPQARWPLVNGCFLAMGGLGAVSATAPVEAALHVTDWRGVFAALSAMTVAASAIIFFVVPEAGKGTGRQTFALQLQGLKRIFRDRLFWQLAPVVVTGHSASMALQSLWAGPWLRDVAGFGRDLVATHLLVLATAMTAGFIAFGALSDVLARLGVKLTHVMIAGVVVFLTAQVVVTGALAPTAMWPWILFGLTSSTTILAYPHLSRHFPLELAGRANTALNLLVFTGVFAVQSAIGMVIDLWQPLGDRYAPEAYRVAFGLVVALQVLALAWYWLAGIKRGTGSATAAGRE